jgi:hypothetical protein
VNSYLLFVDVSQCQYVLVGLKGGDVLPNAADICAGMQYNILLHLARRVQRGFLYCHAKGWMSHSSNHTLVCLGCKCFCVIFTCTPGRNYC